MIKAGANTGATGENAIKVMAHKVNIIIGSLAIIMEDSMMGEITQGMTHAICTSPATKILLPLNRCNVLIAGTLQINLSELIESSVHEVLRILESKKCK